MRLLKLLHLASMAAVVGGLLALLVVAQASPYATADAQAALRQATAALVGWLVVPAVLALFVSGALLMVSRPVYFGARWVWAKSLLWLALGGAVLGVVQPAADRAAGAAQAGARGLPSLQSLDGALAAGHWGAIGCLALALAAIALAVWRPALGRAADGG